MMAVALEIENGVDDMLERFRSRDRAFFCHVAREKYRRAGPLRKDHQFAGYLTNLRHTARRRFDPLAEYCLDRIDYHEIGPELFDDGNDVLEIGFGQEK